MRIAKLVICWSRSAALVATLVLLVSGSARADLINGSIQGLSSIAGGLPIPLTAPLAGSYAGTIGTTPNAAFTVPASVFEAHTSTVFVLPPSAFPFLTSTFDSDITNQAGSFGVGLGPGSMVFCGGAESTTSHAPGDCSGVGPIQDQGTKHGVVTFTAGGNSFGGTMALMGSLVDTITIAVTTGAIRGPIAVPMSVIGGAVGATVTAPGVFSHTTQGWTTPQVAQITGFPWTTGAVVGQATQHTTLGLSTLTTSGYDSRSVNGNIQLVTGYLNHFQGFAPDTNFGHFVLFVPEPGSTAMLVAGLAALPMIHLARRRRS